MGLHFSCLWLKAFKTAEAATLLGPWWSDQIAEDKEHPQRQILIQSAPGDRTLVLDSTCQVPLELAARLCGDLEVEGLWYELAETSLSWRVCRLAGGIIIDDIARPERRADGGIPDYGDAAQDLWEFLGPERIPEALRFARIRDFEQADGDEKPNAVIWTRKALGAEVVGQRVRLQLRDPEGPTSAPIEFTMADTETKSAYDLIVFEGAIDPTGIGRYLKALSRIARRKQVGGWLWKPLMNWFSREHFAHESSERAKARQDAVRAQVKAEFVRNGGKARYGFDLE